MKYLFLISISVLTLTSVCFTQGIAQTAPGKTAIAIFAGGCFWCMEPPFDQLDGVISTTSGYTGGNVKNPDYEQVSSGSTGHAEAVQIIFNPEKISYDQLLSVYWKNIDPTSADGQFCSGGTQYRAEIFYGNEKQKQKAYQSLNALKQNKPFKEPVVINITKAGVFYPAEGSHQDYYIKHPFFYKFYRYTCGRDSRLKELWGDS